MATGIPTVDHCTLFFEGWWSQCCEIHDIEYANFVERVVADINLYECVAKYGTISAIIATIMFVGVRLFGWYFYYKRKDK